MSSETEEEIIWLKRDWIPFAETSLHNHMLPLFEFLCTLVHLTTSTYMPQFDWCNVLHKLYLPEMLLQTTKLGMSLAIHIYIYIYITSTKLLTRLYLWNALQLITSNEMLQNVNVCMSIVVMMSRRMAETSFNPKSLIEKKHDLHVGFGCFWVSFFGIEKVLLSDLQKLPK